MKKRIKMMIQFVSWMQLLFISIGSFCLYMYNDPMEFENLFTILLIFMILSICSFLYGEDLLQEMNED